MSAIHPQPLVVVVDDDPIFLSIVCEELAHVGIAAEGCPHAQHALKFILHRRPRVVLLDVVMPDLDGIELFYQVRNDPLISNTAVIFVTAAPQVVVERLPDFEARGAKLLAKPFDIAAFLRIVSDAIALQSSA